jgi:hypothetical protein
MKNKFVLFLLIGVAGCAHAQHQHSQILKIVFSSSSRGYQEEITITQDSLQTFRNDRKNSSLINDKKKIEKGVWQSLVKSIKDVSVTQIPELKSPSMNRASDGALHSTIKIISKDGKSYEHSFDNEDPAKPLMPLMKKIHSLRVTKPGH